MEMGKLNKKVSFGLVALLGVLMVYGGGVLFYQNRFLPLTKISGMAVGSQTSQVAQEKLQENIKSKEVVLTENGQTIGTVSMETLGGQYDVVDPINQIQSQQSPFAWPLAFFQAEKHEYQLSGDIIQIDDNQILGVLTQVGIDNNQRQVSQDAYINKTRSGFVVEADVTGTQIDPIQFKNEVVKALELSQPSLDLSTTYQKAVVQQDNTNLQNLVVQAQKMMDNTITLRFDGKSDTIASAQIYEWLTVTDSGIDVDREAIEDYIRDLNNEYAGLFNGRYFDSTYSGKVWINPGTYGWYIDRIQEKDKIAEEILKAEKVERDAIVGGSGYGMGDSVGNSYVEVSIDHQMMWIYIEGELALETPIVTGRPGTNTIPGAYQVWNMETPSVLKGYNPHTNVEYQQPVDYWIAFDDQAQGIHDANWQSTFGGGAYLSNGSLGCVNTPPGVMPQVYNLVYYGMPVIIY